MNVDEFIYFSVMLSLLVVSGTGIFLIARRIYITFKLGFVYGIWDGDYAYKRKMFKELEEVD